VRVLVVEDETKMASLLRRGLEREGYAVDVAATGEDALWHTSNPSGGGIMTSRTIASYSPS